MKGLDDISSDAAAGQLLVIGFEGEKYTSALGHMFRKVKPSGAILFARNIRGRIQTKALVADLRKLIQDATGFEPFICLDQEGGRVSRLPEETFPTARELASQGPEKAEEVYRLMGERMTELGFNVDFAPVLDLDTNRKNPIIGDRAFSENHETVAKMALAARTGLASAGVMSCGKHFPGHGGADKDSHLELPEDHRPEERFCDSELSPYAMWTKEKGEFVMTAHVIYPALDSDLVPATLSEKIITGLLRERLGYEGIVITDDMDMKAMTDNYEDAEAGFMALRAGCDMLLGCHNPERIGVLRKAARLAFDGALPAGKMKQKLERIVRLKELIASKED